jgi:hypothetical protein
MYLGDLNRFRANHEAVILFPKTTDPQAKIQHKQAEEKAIVAAQTFYDRAKTVFPHEGKVFHQLGLMSSKEKDYLTAVHLYM